ncbi:MAG: chorismate synthase [Gemmiger sp.]
MKNTFGSAVSLTIFGESHGPAVGAVLDGLAAGLPVDAGAIAAAMDRRRARGDGLSTARVEPDEVEFLSGVLDGHTTGTALTLQIRNTNTRSGDYAKTADLLRPGHADYTAYAKYEGWQDARGGGHFSGRLTAAAVAAGAICEGVLRGMGIRVYTHIAACAGVEDAPLSSAAGLVLPEPQPGHFALLDPEKEAPMQAAIRAAGSEGDSVGGILETVITGLPAGVGEPWFDSVESELAHLAFSIPACKGIEFGAGFAFAGMRGSAANDPFTMRGEHIATATNKNGGINGGITNGMPVVFRTVLKPTPSIYKEQQTVDYLNRCEARLRIKGRHDPCIVPRAAVVQNTLTAFGILDLLTIRYGTLAQKHGLPEPAGRDV